MAFEHNPASLPDDNGAVASSVAQLQLRADFLKQRPLYVNLLDDLGSVDTFVVDGDGLLVECLASPQYDSYHGGQLLHLFYHIENFLHSLTGCLNARFSIVFFQQHECIWADNEQAPVRLARHILQLHLQQTLQQTVHKFKNWQDAAWLDFLTQVPIWFASCMALFSFVSLW